MKQDYSDEYLDALRTLSPERRWETGRGLYWSARRLRAAVLKSVHPTWTEEQIEAEVRKAFMYARD